MIGNSFNGDSSGEEENFVITYSNKIYANRAICGLSGFVNFGVPNIGSRAELAMQSERKSSDLNSYHV